MTEALETVARLIRAWETRDPAAIAACFTPDGVWHNMPYPPLTGPEAIQRAAAGFLAKASNVRFEIHHQAEAGPGVVLNERSDIFEMGEKTMIFPVMGVFEIEGGLIRAWRDYFDPAVMTAASA